MTHPTARQLADLNDGLLDDREADTVASHLGDCTDCRRTFDALAEASDGELRRRLAAAPADVYGDEPQRDLALRRASDLGRDATYETATPDARTALAASPASDDYEILEPIGAGGMGQVYKARHRRMNRIVAIKTLPPLLRAAPEATRRFLREIEAAARLHHPNIVVAHDAGEAAGIHYLVMEYVAGRNLSDVVRDEGPLPIARAVDYCLQAARGLAYAHEQGIVHRDVKPSNLLVDPRGIVKVLDLGLARLRDEAAHDASAELTQAGQLMGTVDYMAPEQALDVRRADARSDVYALGCTLFRLIAGRPPYAGETVLQKVLAHREAPVPTLASAGASASPRLEALLRRMLAKRPEDRPTMAEVVAEWEAETPKPNVASEGRRRRGVRGPIVAAACGGFALLFAGWWLIVRDEQGAERARVRVPDGGTVVVQPDAAASAIRVPKPVGPAPEPAVAPFDADQARQHRDAWAAHLGVPGAFSNSLGMKFVLIPPGEFTMGSPPGEEGRDVKELPHRVRLTRPYYLGVYEVTQDEYARVAGKNPSSFAATSEQPDGIHKRKVAGLDTRRYPVDGVSWHDAATYCDHLSALPEERAAGRTYRLPTEAEWEFACRAGTTTPFHFGPSCNGHEANCNGNVPYGSDRNGPNLGRPTDVGSYAPNAWGVYDMHGNLAEWCSDVFDLDHYAHSAPVDPIGPADGAQRAYRGNSWAAWPSASRAASRGGRPPFGRSDVIGFRIVCAFGPAK